MAKLSLEDLPEELVVEILIRLPHHLAIRCMSVCKFWYSLISKTEFRCRFISLRSSTKKNQPCSFLGYPDSKSNPELMFSTEPVFQSPGFSFNFLPCSSKIRIIETFNDLVLCRDSKVFSSQIVYYICNPLTMQWAALPPAPVLPCSHVCFTCEPYYSGDPIDGIIALNTQHRFKVLRINYKTYCRRICLDIFSSEIGHWKETILSLPQHMALKYILNAVASANEKKLILLGPSTAQDQLVTLIVKGENFDEYHKVVVPIEHYHIYRLTLCKRSLCLAHLTFQGKLNLQTWELNEYREWKLVHSVSDLEEMDSKDEFLAKDHKVIHFLMELSNPHVLEFHRDVLCVRFQFGGVFASYDLRGRTLNFVPKTVWDRRPTILYPLDFPFWPTPVPQISEVAVHHP